MAGRAKLITIVSVSGLAGVLMASLALAGNLRSRVVAAHDHAGGAPLCRSAATASEPSFYSEMARVNARMHADMNIEPTGNPDRDFARMMIPHHQGAIDMALVELKYGKDEKLKRLAQSIIVEQGQEIAYMRMLLGAPPKETPTPDSSGEK